MTSRQQAIESATAQSRARFLRYVWPVLHCLAPFRGSQLVPVEGCRALRDVDRVARVDYLQVVPWHGVRGIASRVHAYESGRRCFGTFTLRVGSSDMAELGWFQRQLESGDGWIAPHYVVESYVAISEGDEPRAERILVATVRSLVVAASAAVQGAEHDLVEGRDWGYASASNAAFLWLTPQCVERVSGAGAVWSYRWCNELDCA